MTKKLKLSQNKSLFSSSSVVLSQKLETQRSVIAMAPRKAGCSVGVIRLMSKGLCVIVDFTQTKKSYKFLAFYSFGNQSPNQRVVPMPACQSHLCISVRGPASVTPPLQAQRTKQHRQCPYRGSTRKHGKSNTPLTMYLTIFMNTKHMHPGKTFKIQGKFLLFSKMLQCNYD